MASADLFGGVLDALAPPVAPAAADLPGTADLPDLPDLAVCADDPGFFFERSLYQLGDRYWRIIARYGAVAIDPGLVSFTWQTG